MWRPKNRCYRALKWFVNEFEYRMTVLAMMLCQYTFETSVQSVCVQVGVHDIFIERNIYTSY